ncbi:putative methyltransferase [Helianthus anomalus]
MVPESHITSFNIPLYFPGEDGIGNIIKYERSFSLESMNDIEFNRDPQDTYFTSTNDSNELRQILVKHTSKVTRDILEPLLISHFEISIIYLLFKKFEKHVLLDQFCFVHEGKL